MSVRKTYTMREAAEILGVAYSTLAEQTRNGRADYLHPIRIGARWLFPKRIIDALVEGAA